MLERISQTGPTAGSTIRCRALAGSVLAAALTLSGVARADSGPATRVPKPVGTVVYGGGQVDPGSSYSRMIRLEHNGSANGRLIATHEDFDKRGFPIYESYDDGRTWGQEITTVYEGRPNSAGWDLRWQPDLFELPQAVGDLPAGALLLAGTSVGSGPSMFIIELYVSIDQGRTWRYRSTVASSVGASKGGIFEPNVQLAADGTLMIYYSDETQAYSQAIVQKQSTDGGRTWGARQNVVAIGSDLNQRPGMPVVTRMGNGRYIMSFEAVRMPDSEVHVKFSDDGKNWGDPASYGTAIRTQTGSYLGATPFIRWTPVGGGNGALFVSGQKLRGTPNTDRELMMSRDFGSTWTMVPSPVQWQGATDNVEAPGWNHAGWSQAILETADGAGIIHMASSYAGGGINKMLVGRENIIVPGQRYTLVNQNSELAVDIPGGSSTPGQVLKQWTVNNNPAQTFTFRDLGDNKYVVVNPQNNLAWDNPGGKSVAGAAVQQWTQNGLTAQQWRLLPVGNGSWKFQNVASGLVMAVDGMSETPGAAITQWSDNDTIDHNWFPVPR